MTGPIWILRALALAVPLALAAPGAGAQLPGMAAGEEGGDPATDAPPPAARALLSLLADPAVQDWLERELADAPAAAESEDQSFHAWLQGRLAGVEAHVVTVAEAAEALPDEVDRAAAVWAIEMPGERTWAALFGVAVFVGLGVALEALYWRAAGRVRRRIGDAPAAAAGREAVLGRVGLRLLLDGLAVVVFALGTVGAFLMFDWTPITRLLIVSLLLAFVIVRLVDAVAAFFLAPWVPPLRLVPLGTPAARRLYRWIRALAVVAAFGFLFCGAVAELGLLPRSRLLLVYAVGLVLAGMAVTMIWQCRRPVAAAIRGGEGTESAMRVRTALADLWPYLSTAYVVLVYALWVIGASGLLWTLIALVAVPLADRAGCWVINGAMRRRPAGAEEEQAAGEAAPAAPAAGETLPTAPPEPAPETAPAGAPEPAAEGEVSPYAPVVHRVFRLVLVATAIVLLASAWGANLTALFDPDTGGALVLTALFDIAVTVILADLLWQTARIAIDRRLADMGGPPDAHGLHDTGGEGGGGAVGPQARLRTLLPLVRKSILAVLMVMVAMIVLSSLGVDIGPLLAGAGVVGIAIGFGAQALVRDIVAGLFFLLDDAFRVGEYVEIGELRGTVEGISIRSLRLRHHRGALHTIPFGEMRSLTNYSRDWVIMKLEFRVPFETDLALVKRIVKTIGKDLLKDPTLGPGFIEPLKSQGVRRWEEFNMVVGVKFMARPGQQFLIRREAYQRIRDAFEAHGIHFARRDVTVKVSKDATPEEIEEAVSGAAMTAVGADQGPPGQAPGKKSA